MGWVASARRASHAIVLRGRSLLLQGAKVALPFIAFRPPGFNPSLAKWLLHSLFDVNQSRSLLCWDKMSCAGSSRLKGIWHRGREHIRTSHSCCIDCHFC